MAIVCPACGILNAPTAQRCDCGRALAPGVVDRVAPPAAIDVSPEARRVRRRRLVRAATLVVAPIALVFAAIWIWRTWIDPPTRVERLRSSVARACGSWTNGFDSDAYVTLSGCQLVASRAPHVRSVNASIAYDRETGRAVRASARALGWSDNLAAPRGLVLGALAPALSADQRAAARAALERLALATDDAPDITVGDLTIRGATRIWREGVPWERFAELSIAFDADRALPSAVAPIPSRSSFGAFGPDVRAAWGALCRDDAALGALLGAKLTPEPSPRYTGGTPSGRWAEDDVWLYCAAHSVEHGEAFLRMTAVWDATTSRLLHVDIALDAPDPRAALLGLVDRLLAPVLDPAVADLTRTVARGDSVREYAGDLTIERDTSGPSLRLFTRQASR
jgi:hypothetical protein